MSTFSISVNRILGLIIFLFPISLALARQLQAEEEHFARQEHEAYLRERKRRQQIAQHEQEEQERKKKDKKKDCIIM